MVKRSAGTSEGHSGKKNSRALTLLRMQNPEIVWQTLQEQHALTPWQDEYFLGVALEQWALKPASGDPSSALKRLADGLKTNHDDPWLLDFLHAPSSAQGNKLLLAALDANHAGNADRGLTAAGSAYAAYLRSNNPAGALRSEFEIIYALQRKSRATECIRRATVARTLSSRLGYWWINIQATIEQASCEEMRNRADAAYDLAKAANHTAAVARYGNLQLRAMGLSGNLAMAEGNSEGTWASDMHGLKLFWEGSYPDDRAFQFYYNLQVDSERNHAVYVAEALQREALLMIAGRSRFDFEAMAHFRMASAAAAAGDEGAARQEVSSSRSVLEKLPPSSAREVYNAYCEIGLARLAMRFGSATEAARHLDSAQLVVSHGENSVLLLEYLTTRAELDRAYSDLTAEQKDLRNVVSIGDHGFANLKSAADRWRWREVVEASYRRLLEIEISSPHSKHHALGYWELLRQSESAPSLTGAAHYKTADIEALTKARLSRFAGSTLISFAVLPDNLVAWVADTRGVHEFVLHVTLTELRREVRRFYSLCSDPGSDPAKVNESGSRLYKLLIGPLETVLDPDRVWDIEPDGFLSMIPWSALTMPDGAYMGQERTLAIYGGLFTSPAKPRSKRAVKTVLAANPESITFNDKVFPALPDAEAEVAELERLYKNTLALRGRVVTVSNVLQQLPKANIFEFVGHALTRTHGGELALHGQDGSGAVLSASGVEQLQLKNTELVVLGACSTAAEADADRDPNGLVRAFLNAGVTQVLAGRWDLDSVATAEMMKTFHISFTSEMSGAQSLRTARQQVSSRNRFSHPYYWAGMEIFTSN